LSRTKYSANSNSDTLKLYTFCNLLDRYPEICGLLSFECQVVRLDIFAFFDWIGYIDLICNVLYYTDVVSFCLF